VQWLYFGYLAGVKEQNGAAMSLGRTSTFLDIYFERDLAAGTLTESQAQEIIDDFVIKLRIVRFLRTPEYDELFAGDPTWVTESIGGMGDDGRPLVTKTSFRMLQTLLQPRPRPGARTLTSGTRRAAGRPFRPLRRQGPRSTPARCQFESDESCAAPGGDDGAIACCVLADAARQANAVLRRARQHCAKCLLYADQRRARRNSRRADAPGVADRSGRGCSEFDDVLARFEQTMAGSPRIRRTR
jgi:formate C-acetyltransferase